MQDRLRGEQVTETWPAGVKSNECVQARPIDPVCAIQSPCRKVSQVAFTQYICRRSSCSSNSRSSYATTRPVHTAFAQQALLWCAPTEQAASGPQAATRCSRSAPVSKLSGCRAKTLELILLPSPAETDKRAMVDAHSEAAHACTECATCMRGE